MRQAGKIRVGWILIGDERYGSARIQGLNVHKYLCANGVESSIIKSPAVASPKLGLSVVRKFALAVGGFDIFIFQKVFDAEAIKFARLLRLLGKKTVFVLCDWIETEMSGVVDVVVTPSTFLAKKLHERYGVTAVVIDDAIEDPPEVERNSRRNRESGASSAVWVGSKDNWATLQRPLSAMARSSLFKSVELVSVSDHAEATLPWSLATAHSAIANSDFALLPTGTSDWAMSKSSNRLSMYLAHGIPVIAEPIPAYRELAALSGGVLWVDRDADWADKIALMCDPDFRATLAAGVESRVRAARGISSIGPMWLKCLERLSGKTNSRQS